MINVLIVALSFSTQTSFKNCDEGKSPDEDKQHLTLGICFSGIDLESQPFFALMVLHSLDHT